MKIGILTFHNAYNYGAILQTYATQELLRMMGHEVEVIDYHNKAVDTDYENRRFHFKSFKKSGLRFPLYLIEKYYYYKRRKGYQHFVDKYINLSQESYYQSEEISFVNYDAILIGSDQVWNKKITGGFDDAYWGHFKKGSKSKVIAWSVCMNNTDLSAEELCYVEDSLKGFNSISVREDSLLTFITPLTNKEIFHTSDPTLVLPSKKWMELCQSVKEQNYIAVYAVREEWKTIRFAQQVARLQNKRLVVICAYSGWNFGKEYKEYLSPVGFLSYIKNASMVITSSFHGTAFSILFKKDFICPLFEENVRIKSLLNSYTLNDRVVHTPTEVLKLQPIDYARIIPVIDELSSYTMNFLKTAFS